MRFCVISDLHIDIDNNAWRDPPAVDADVVIVIGDVTNPMTSALPWVVETYGAGGRPVIYVPGNHDFYCGPERSTYYQDQMARGREMAERLGIILLQNSVVEVGGVDGGGGIRVAGATTWGDFSILPRGMTVKDAMSQSQKGWYEGGWRNYEKNYHNDFRAIRYAGPGSKNRFTPSQMLALHRESKVFFERVLATPFDGDTICVSHMGPAQSVEPGDHSWLYGWSDLQHTMHGPLAPRYWLHGHVHRSLDYTIGDTRIVCNPRGYPVPGGARENPDFNPHLVIEVGVDPTPSMRI